MNNRDEVLQQFQNLLSAFLPEQSSSLLGGNFLELLRQLSGQAGGVRPRSPSRRPQRAGMPQTLSAGPPPSGGSGRMGAGPYQPPASSQGYTPPAPWMIPSGPNGEMQAAPYQTPMWTPVEGTPVAGGGLWYPYGWRGSTITGGEIPGRPGERATISGPPDPNAIVGGTPDPKDPTKIIGGMTNAYMAKTAAEAEYRPPNGQPWWTLPGQLPHRVADPNSPDPIWKQLGFYNKDLWRQDNKPTEMGLQRPTLTDPNTGIYHYELFSPEWLKEAIRADQSNRRWSPRYYPGPAPSIDEYTRNAGRYGYQTHGPARPIPPWMPGGSEFDAGTPRWSQQGFASKAEWRAAGKP